MSNLRPLTTLFLLQSLDGKITPGSTDVLDVDTDFPKIRGLREGLPQYYELERQTDLVSMNSGRVQAKVGVNQRDFHQVEKTDISFIVVDSHPHLNTNGCQYFARRSKTFFLVTTNPSHPAFALKSEYDNIETFLYAGQIDFVDFFQSLKQKYGVERVTIQTGGTLNAHLLRLRLIDYVSIVVAPCLIGGVDTQTLIGGESLHTEEDLQHIRPLKLLGSHMLEHSYLHLQYEVDNSENV